MIQDEDDFPVHDEDGYTIDDETEDKPEGNTVVIVCRVCRQRFLPDTPSFDTNCPFCGADYTKGR